MPFELETVFTNPVQYTVQEGEPPIPLSVIGVPSGIRLIARSMPMTEGAVYSYAYDSDAGIIYRTSLDTIRRVRGFRTYMNEQGGNSVFIAERELSLFAGIYYRNLRNIMMCRFRNFARRIISLTRRSLPFIWICQNMMRLHVDYVRFMEKREL